MKNKLFIGALAGVGIVFLALMFAICFNKPIGDLFQNNSGRYAFNLYDEDFQYTRGLEAFYDKNGELKSAEVYIIYDSNSLELSYGSDDSGAKYPEAESSCVINDDGSVKISNFITAKSIEAGALSDKDFYIANLIYDKIKTEDDIKSFLESQRQLASEKCVPDDGINYIIINGKNISW